MAAKWGDDEIDIYELCSAYAWMALEVLFVFLYVVFNYVNCCSGSPLGTSFGCRTC